MYVERIHIHRGFSMIELLVVISIIVMLISITLPSLRNAKEEGRTTVCLANQHNIWIATRTYGDDFVDQYPYGVPQPISVVNHPHNQPWGPSRGHGVPPQQQFYSLNYITDPAVWICPSDPTPLNYAWWDFTEHPDITGGSSYMFSEDALFGVAWKDRFVLRHQNVWQPSTFGFMTDGYVCPNGWTWAKVDPQSPVHPQPPLPWSVRIDWSHLHRVCVLWGDGHGTSEPQLNIADRVRQHPLYDY